jgi:hypothetical protein
MSGGTSMSVDYPQLPQVWDAFKTIAPWLTGGLAGSILTFFLNRRAGRNKQTRLAIESQRIDYSVPSKGEGLKGLRVSYDGKVFDSLLNYQMTVQNISARTAKTSPFLLSIDGDMTIVDRSILVQPLDRDTSWAPQPNQPGSFIWDAGELKPGDSARLRLLVSPSADVRWSWRGEDEVEVTSDGSDNLPAMDREFRNAVVWIALYITLGGIPFFSGAAQGAMIMISLPYIVRYLLQWRRYLFAGRLASTPSIVIAGSTSKVAVSNDLMGRVSSISIETADK